MTRNGRLCLLLAALLFAGELRAAGAELVEDIATGQSPFQTALSQFFTFRGKVLFFAGDNLRAPTLWSSDGTAEGTSPLGILCPLCGDTQLLGATPAVAFFSVQLRSDGPGNFLSIWRTDGTRAGTYPVTGTLRTPPLPLAFRSAVGESRAYFTACTPEQGCEVWSSDGTVQGTGPVEDRVPGPGSFEVHEMAALGDRAYILGRGSASQGLWRADAASHTVIRLRAVHAEHRPLLTVAGNRLFFLAQADGPELWTSDGSAAGTFAVSRYAAADPFLATRFLKPIDGRLYFLADDGVHGIELWSVRVTGSGLQAVTDFQSNHPFEDGAPRRRFVASSLESAGGRLVFAASDGRTGFRLWTSRGRPGTTQPIEDCPDGCPRVLAASQLERLEDRLVFAGRDDAHGMEPWTTDGTGAGTRLLRDLTSGPGDSAVRGFTSRGGHVFFERVLAEREPVEVWATDGTEAGTLFVALGRAAEPRFVPPPPDPHLDLAALGGRTLFMGHDLEQEVFQLWISDGTQAGSRSLHDWPRPASSSPEFLRVLGGHAVFTACRDLRNELWLSGGTAATTVQVDVDLGPCNRFVLSEVAGIGAAGGLGVFRLSREYADGLDDGSRIQIWRTDGTAAGTAPITSFQGLTPGLPVPLADKALFQVPDFRPAGPGGASLWVTDGTAAGTERRVDLPGLSVLYETGFGSQVFFLGIEEGENLVRIWRTDGTAAGTFPITGVVSRPTNGYLAPEFTRLGDRIYFLVRRVRGRTEIWSTDGTPQGTGPVVTVATDPKTADSLWTAGGLLFFRLRELGSVNGVLWRTDGTPAGTFPLGADLHDDLFAPVHLPWYPSWRFATLGGEVFFQAYDAVHGTELWKSDGTREGTVLVRDIFPGLGGSYPLWLVAVGDRIYFAANDGRNGRELWTSDGTAEGTRRVADIAPDASWSFPDWLTVAGDQLFFAADDGTHGRELWRNPL